VIIESDYNSYLDLRQIDREDDRGIIPDQDPMANSCVNGFESYHSIMNFHF
jgi:hypothetical protein